MSRALEVALIRQWEIVQLLQSARAGLTVSKLLEGLEGVSRPTLYRELKALRAAGVPVHKELRNGETRYSFYGNALPALTLSPEEATALSLAVRTMTPLLPTAVGSVLTKLLARCRAEQPPEHIHLSTPGEHAPVAQEALRRLDSAIRNRCRVELTYRGAKDAAPLPRQVDPAALRLQGKDVYVDAFDLGSQRWKTFKLARVADVTVLRERATTHGGYNAEALYRQAVKVWDAEAVNVVVRLNPRVARFAAEWPLHKDQTVTLQEDGSALLHATVNGLQEASRWVLSWGQGAEVISPSELVELVRGELSGALSSYEKSDPVGPKRARESARRVERKLDKVSHSMRTGGA